MTPNENGVRAALEETQSLLAAMLHETRPSEEIEAQMNANRAALSTPVPEEGLPRGSASVAEGGWQTIETAPKDETLVWLFEPHAAGGFMFAGLFDAKRQVWINNLDQQAQKPTYWMPLPDEPAPTGQDDGVGGDGLTFTVSVGRAPGEMYKAAFAKAFDRARAIAMIHPDFDKGFLAGLSYGYSLGEAGDEERFEKSRGAYAARVEDRPRLLAVYEAECAALSAEAGAGVAAALPSPLPSQGEPVAEPIGFTNTDELEEVAEGGSGLFFAKEGWSAGIPLYTAEALAAAARAEDVEVIRELRDRVEDLRAEVRGHAEAIAASQARLKAVEVERDELKLCDEILREDYAEAAQARRAAEASLAETRKALETAAEDERDRLYAIMVETWSTQTARAVLRGEGAMLPADRAALRSRTNHTSEEDRHER